MLTAVVGVICTTICVVRKRKCELNNNYYNWPQINDDMHLYIIMYVAEACKPETVLMTQDNPAYDYLHNISGIVTQKNAAYEDITKLKN